MAVRAPVIHGRRVNLVGASLEHALHRCVDLASPLGSVLIQRARQPSIREFILELDESRERFRWALAAHPSGVELVVTRVDRLAFLPPLGRRAAGRSEELGRKLDLLPHLLNLRVVVLGSGTGLYTTLLGLRDRTASLTAIIAGLQTAGPRRKDEIGSLPRDDASLCLLALASSGEEMRILRSLLEHRLERAQFFGARFGTLLLEALCEMRESPQAGLDEASTLLATAGRIVIASAATLGPPADGRLSDDAQQVINDADLVVVAPGHFDDDIRPSLDVPGLLEALRTSRALTVAVTKVMTAERETGPATASYEVGRLTALAPEVVDVALVNEPAFTTRQLDAYAALGARPITPDVEATARLVPRVRRERLTSSGDLARHDANLLGEQLLEIGAETLLTALG